MVSEKTGKKKVGEKWSRKKIGSVRIPEGHFAFVTGNGDVIALKRKARKVVHRKTPHKAHRDTGRK